MVYGARCADPCVGRKTHGRSRGTILLYGVVPWYMKSVSICVNCSCIYDLDFYEEFDPGSGLTLAACLTHASRTRTDISLLILSAKWRTGE